MNRPTRPLLVLFVLMLFVVPVVPAAAQAPVDPFWNCDRGVFAETGASWVICMPERIGIPWNGDLMIYSHGYVSPYPERPPEIPIEQYMLPDGPTFPDMFNTMGYAFATTSFRTNGLAVKDGVADIMDLWGEFKLQHALKRPSRVYMFGASEGGLVATQVIEKHPPQFDGGVAACGPIGDFRMQVDHVGDMRVVFDYFFPGMLPPTAIDIPEPVMANWQDAIAPNIGFALATSPLATAQLLNVTQAAVDPINPATAVDTVLGVLWYNVFATNDARAKVGGNPLDNVSRQYSGSADDTLLNNTVARFEADQNALSAIKAHYQTTGRLRTPLLTMHNTLDPIVPYAHAVLYGEKVARAGSSGLYAHIPAPRYGHCNFTSAEVLAALNWVVTMSGGPAFSNARAALPGEAAYQRFLELTSDLSAAP